MPEFLKRKPRQSDSIEPIVWLLFAAVVLFAGLLLWVSRWQGEHSSLFTVLVTVLSNFSGALFTKIKATIPPLPGPHVPEPTSVTTTIEEEKK